jgi:hypothetical protein
MERETRLELATSTLARLYSRSSNPLIHIIIMHFDGSLIGAQDAHQALNEATGGRDCNDGILFVSAIVYLYEHG